MRLDRTWIIRVLLSAGAVASLAAYLYLSHRESSDSAQFGLATRDRAAAIRREVESRATLLGVATHLLSRDNASPESLQDVIDGYRGGRSEGVMALWTPWDGVGDPPADWGSVRRFTSAWAPVPGSAPAWFDDALRRVARGSRAITVPAATPEGAELLIFAAPVIDARGRMKGVAMIAARVSQVVEQALGNTGSAGIEVVAEDVTLGGRRIYQHGSRMEGSQPTFDVPIRFADRVWTLHAASAPDLLPDRDSRTRAILLAACLLLSLLAAAMPRKKPQEAIAPAEVDESPSLHDPLTGLPNRRLFDDRMEQTLAEARRAGSTFAICYLEIDGFHRMNETLGSAVADALVIEIAQRLRACLRASDTLARLGGGEFGIIAAHLHEAADSERVAAKLIDCVTPPWPAGGRQIALGASLGVSLFPRHSGDAGELLQNAHTALGSAQRDGGNRFTMFTPELGRVLRERTEMEGQLRGAAARGEIVVHYQPEYDLRSGQLIGFESRARWKHPELGLISPARFIPVAEESGLIVPVGLAVLEQSCREAVRWQNPGTPPVRVAVKISNAQFLAGDFVESVCEILERTGLPPRLLQLEITESAVRTSLAGAAAKMKQLCERGIMFALDDFGAGGFSFGDLPRLPFAAMKIDRSFVHNLHRIADSRSMIQSLVSLAHNLNLKVVAEGIESPEELAAVRALGCDTVQGYLLGRPSTSTAKHLAGDRRLILPSESLTYS